MARTSAPKHPLGRYVDDYEWVAGVGDLDQYNGRFTVTPEFPNGTYAYYATIDDSGDPAFPYLLAGEFYGVVSGGFSSTVSSAATDYFNAGTVTAGHTAPSITSWSIKNWNGSGPGNHIRARPGRNGAGRRVESANDRGRLPASRRTP